MGRFNNIIENFIKLKSQTLEFLKICYFITIDSEILLLY